MSTWVAAIVETRGRPDFWDVARGIGVESTKKDVPPYVVISCDASFDMTAVFTLSKDLSAALATTVIGFVIQTGVDTHFTHVYRDGVLIRRLEYEREGDHWIAVEGTAQPWEPAYFFGKELGEEDWPDMLWDEISDADLARYQKARTAGAIGDAIDLIHPSSTAPMHRVCERLGIPGGTASGTWSPPRKSLWSRFFGDPKN
jgi:hypothetical protein